MDAGRSAHPTTQATYHEADTTFEWSARNRHLLVVLGVPKFLFEDARLQSEPRQATPNDPTFQPRHRWRQ